MTVRPADLAQTLRRRHRQRREGHEKRAVELRRTLVSDLQSAKENGILRHAWLIGSLAGGHFGAHSDIDLVVEGLDRRRDSIFWSELQSRLGVEVDLLEIETLPPDFRARVLEEGIPLDVSR